jgi:hypothetical protein
MKMHSSLINIAFSNFRKRGRGLLRIHLLQMPMLKEKAQTIPAIMIILVIPLTKLNQDGRRKYFQLEA